MEITKRSIRFALFMLLAVLSLGGCHNGNVPASTTSSTTSTSTTSTSTTGTTTTGTGTTTTTTPPAPTYTMTLAPGVTTLSAGGTTSLTAKILANGVVDTTQAVSVDFTSTCFGQKKATISTPIVSSAGVAVSSYTDINCASTDTLAASASVGGTTISATASLTVQAAAMGSIVFVSATPANIGIKGVGLTETSAVLFQVKDVLGQPAPAGQGVTFSLDTTTGGITFSPATANTDSNGYVTTYVTSGTVPATVRVTATLNSNTAIKSQSSGLVISTGISDQKSFSMSADNLNVEGWQYDGITSNITVHASDHFNNPVPDGTPILFTSDGGQIPSSCTTTGGACSVTWTSSNPRPANGRVVIMATMTGEESFTDTNGNNRYDDGEPFTDMPEAWLDANENGQYDTGEVFRDFNGDGVYSPGDGKYNGVLCAGPTMCGTSKSIDVRMGNFVIVMSESFFNISVTPLTGIPVGTVANGTIQVCGQYTNNLPPSGTTVTATSTYGTVTLVGNGTVPNSSAAGCYNVPFTFAPGTTAGTGSMTITVTTPKGNVTSAGVAVSGV